MNLQLSQNFNLIKKTLVKTKENQTTEVRCWKRFNPTANKRIQRGSFDSGENCKRESN